MKTILITGCSTGIGRALAVELASRGARVFATARRPETLADIASDNLIPLALDVTQADSRAAALARVLEQAGHLDVLVNNAGVSLIAPIVEAPFERVRQVIDTNLLSTIGMIQLVFPHMADRGGRIVNLGSAIGVMPSPFSGVYCASKAAVHMLSEVLRLELAPFDIDVVTVQPAAVRSEIEDRSAEGLEAFSADTSRYQRFFHALQMRLERPKENPVSAESYARDLADAVLAEHAPRKVLGGRGSTTYQIAGRLPGAVRDFFLRREFGLPSKRAAG